MKVGFLAFKDFLQNVVSIFHSPDIQVYVPLFFSLDFVLLFSDSKILKSNGVSWINAWIYIKLGFLAFKCFLDNVFKTIYSQDIDIYVF